MIDFLKYKIKYLAKSGIVFLLFAIVSSCEYEKQEPVDTSSIPETVSFQEHIVPILNNNCIDCHNGTTPPDLTERNAYFDLDAGGYLKPDAPESSLLFEKISGNGSMKQYASDLDRAFILKWIEQGAEEN